MGKVLGHLITGMECSESATLYLRNNLAPFTDSSEVVENKDVDLRVLHPAVTEANVAPIGQKRSSPESSEPKSKKSKPDKFDM